MGVDFHGFNFLNYVKDRYGDFGSTIQLGRQEFLLSKKFKNKIGIGNLQYFDQASDSLFGTSIVDSMDYSNYEGATIVHDLNLAVAEDLTQKYDTVLDLGTTEHVFNTSQVLENCDKMIKFGGRIIHVLPANNFNGHGFYQFSPELFFSFYSKSNGYESEVFLVNLRQEKYWYKVKAPSEGKRLQVNEHGPMYVLVVATKINDAKSDILQTDYKFVWANEVNTDVEKDNSSNKVDFVYLKNKIKILAVVQFNIIVRLYYVFVKRNNLEKFYFKNND